LPNVRPSSKSLRGKRFTKYGFYFICFLILVGVIVAITIGVKSAIHDRKSSQLTSSVKTLENGKHTCKQGIQQLSSDTPQLGNNTAYSTTAREQALQYVMACTFMAGNPKQAIAYADQLNSLYMQDGSKSAQKQTALQQYISYMKKYETSQ
jgi:t-SNARE complex subunit (syntaxin)